MVKQSPGSTRWSGEPVRINLFDDDNGSFFVLTKRRGATQPVADVPTWPAGDLWRIGLRRVFELQRNKIGPM
jgi:hypothetical protein